MENDDIHSLPYFSEGFLSTYRNLLTYQWRSLQAFGKKLGIHIFSLGQKRFFLHQADFVLYPQSHHWRWQHNLDTEGLAVPFTSFCGFQGQNERESFFFFSTKTLHTSVILWICENVFKVRVLFLFFALTCGCRERWQAQNTSTSCLLFTLHA